MARKLAIAFAWLATTDPGFASEASARLAVSVWVESRCYVSLIASNIAIDAVVQCNIETAYRREPIMVQTGAHGLSQQSSPERAAITADRVNIEF